MGTLRFLLALSVVWTHAALPMGLSGDLCVTIFFAISGFYMAMVLSEKEAYSRPSTFYKQRLLRLIPLYWALLVPSLLLTLFEPSIRQGWQALVAYRVPQDHPGLFLGWVLSQLFVFGQDVVLFFGLDSTGRIVYEPTISQAVAPLGATMLIPPAWSLALELEFYLIAPFLARRSNITLITLMLTSCAVRLGLSFGLGYVNEAPWPTRLFPSELAFFLLGMLGFRLVVHPDAPIASRKGLAFIAATLIVVGSLSANRFGQVNTGLISKGGLATLLLTAIIPWLFQKSRDWHFDRHIGEYSYPLYLCHILIFEIWRLTNWKSTESYYAMVAACVAFAVFLTYAIDKPVDRLRHQLLRAR